MSAAERSMRGSAGQCCPHHESIEHRLGKVERKMDRLEVGIFGMLVALVISMISLFVQIWDLPREIRDSRPRDASVGGR